MSGLEALMRIVGIHKSHRASFLGYKAEHLAMAALFPRCRRLISGRPLLPVGRDISAADMQLKVLLFRVTAIIFVTQFAAQFAIAAPVPDGNSTCSNGGRLECKHYKTYKTLLTRIRTLSNRWS